MIKVNDYVIEQNHFPDRTLHVNAIDGFSPTCVTWLYESDAELFTLICIRQHYKNIPLTLYMPYCPHARMDRVKKGTDVFTLKHFCGVINSLHFEKVYITDAHSNVATALLDRCVNVNVEDKIKKVVDSINDDCLVAFYPDEGAMKRYSEQSNLPYAFGIKKRDWSSGKILGLQLINEDIIAGNNILIIDDICSRGGTFYHSANALKEAGANDIYLYITHAEMTMVYGDMYNQDIVNKIFTTNSLFKPEWDVKGKVQII